MGSNGMFDLNFPVLQREGAGQLVTTIIVTCKHGLGLVPAGVSIQGGHDARQVA